MQETKALMILINLRVYLVFFFYSGLLPDTIQLSRFTVLPSMYWGGGALNVQEASHRPNQ